MKIIYFISIILTLTIMTGCSQSSSSSSSSFHNQTNKSSSSIKDISKQDSTTPAKQKSTEEKHPWTKKQSKELKKFVDKWSLAADQTYREYTGHGSIKTFGGVSYPQAFNHKKFSIDNHQLIKLGWSPNGEDKYEYNVVAIYNRNVAINGWHTTYLFCLHKGKPVILVDSTSNVEIIALTINMDENLNKGFEKIAN
ncbi:hypothetical protein J2Z60_001854 [Lactobacillus colini]|uniref:DUF4767 domain-containing protein n=1 Tax=Lactobacillus colini TaxID=1819254 RepID=A0ABS4MH52_9LACO|nr:DUF4767 domain-containing protein [Lactobacillus colini]MBP2058666.1 hypothetical protein [Lactobacillus colini]